MNCHFLTLALCNTQYFQGAEKVKCSFTRYFHKTKYVPCTNVTGDLVSLQRIQWKSKPYEALDATLEKNFILKHEQFVDPSFVLQVNISRSVLQSFDSEMHLYFTLLHNASTCELNLINNNQIDLFLKRMFDNQSYIIFAFSVCGYSPSQISPFIIFRP